MPNLNPDERLAVVGDYKHGSIRRIKLRNFLTYFDAEITPGPRLNMVIGPNGTGKSTILCAMCLGLGGEPRLLGRASEVETFIANGQDESDIEIELVNTKGGENPIVRREIRRKDENSNTPKSRFFWDGKQCTAKSVKERCLEEYDITVDNLCTFLPQDKVGNFSGFDSKQLLIETEKALTSSQKHYHTHMELIKQQEEMRGGENQRQTLEDRLRHLVTEGKRLERAKELMQERDRAVEQAQLLKMKTMWLEFDEHVVTANLKNAAKKELKAKAETLRKALQPLEEEYTNAKEGATKFAGDIVRMDKEIQACLKEMSKQIVKYQNHDDQIELIKSEIENLESQRAFVQQKVDQLREKIELYDNQMEAFPTVDVLKEDEAQRRSDLKSAMNEHKEASKACQSLISEYKDIQDELNRVQAKVSKLQDDKARRCERIFRAQPNLQKISNWLRENRNIFRKEVYGPVVCEITPKDSETASYLEMHVPNAALKSFVTQCKEDYDLLYKRIREELEIPINITIITGIKQEERFYSEEKMQILKREHGVLGYMDETIEAPPLILEALKNAAQIHKVLIGSEKTQDSLDNKGLLDFLSQPEGGKTTLNSSCIFSSKNGRGSKYQTVISKYDGKASTRIDNARPAKWLAPGVSEQEKEKYQAELSQIRGRHDELKPAVDEARAKLAEAEARAQVARENAKKAKDNLQLLGKLESRKQNTEAKLREAEKDLAVDNDAVKSGFVQKLEKRINSSLQALEAHSESYKKMMKAVIKSSGIRLNSEALKAIEIRLRDQLREAKVEFDAALREAEAAKNDYKEAVKEVHRLKKEADRLAPLTGEDGNYLPLKATLDDLGVETLPEALAALEEAELKVDSIEADNNAIREFQRNASETDEVRSLLDDLNCSEDKKKQDLEEKVGPWKMALSAAVSKVNTLFSKYMAEMGCTGEVALTEGESTPEMPFGNFQDWGIEIRVSFRGNTKLQVLSARGQSGGERSVSTIMYLMALQDLMVSPFRCVDEINQGLDERNERLVFKRIVKNSTGKPGRDGPTDHAGQYFLITPKLLPNLYDMEVEAMTVLFIFNGPFNVRNPRDFDVSKLLGLRKRVAIESEAADDEENTPNSQPSESRRPTKQARRSLSARHVEAET